MCVDKNVTVPDMFGMPDAEITGPKQPRVETAPGARGRVGNFTKCDIGAQMSIFIDVSMHNREQIVSESVVRFEPYLARRTKTISTSVFGLADAFVEIDGAIAAYAVDRTENGFIVWVGRVNVNLSWTTGHVKMAKVICMGLVVGAAFTLSGFPRWGATKPLEIVLWAAMVKKYIA